MERIITILLIFMLGISAQVNVQAQEIPLAEMTIPQMVSYDNCTRTYNIPAEKLFYLTLASISANRFEIKEMQSKTGYILFKAASKDFLATVVYFGLNKSMVKITPTNNNYYFAPGIVYNIFKYIDLNYDKPVESIPKG